MLLFQRLSLRKESTVSKWALNAAVAILGLLLVACSSNKANTSKASAGSYSGSVYIVKRGDTLYRISRMTGSSVGELARLNGISAPYTLEIGQKIRVKGSSAKKKTAVAKTSKPRSSTSSNTSVAKVAAPPVGSRCWRWPTSGKIIEPFSSSDGGNKGIDIAGSRGQPIYASAAGTVVYVGDQLRGYGNLVMIKHSEDYITAYAHNDTTLVNNGQKVSAGQKIATMGSTGSDSVNLHFQIRYRATALDPLRYLPPQGSKPSC
ncbi:peptidoglycan DD-metalloendopeptidase family protein [Enterobacteriaceae bacterium H20N1]|uniref:Peptidoglycan DD-metalloendopeptidase family protein n=1 Tax=Dryocola boscaweniae TaxID=2925397 RepID=A0A9X2W8H7_9ENTR|nr:amidase activator ActS [Dryocola boscaweniae]MCT4702745.1 peptidoglycan DD-metalloendopeptidase family protein [Dryocola boscaweniae]MCT4719913.1 peptidoglycan DD-metalloendopeptidase family protein [Dryocola boscaweniae]